MSKHQPDLMSTIVSLCKRRGFVFQSSEIYGGLNGCWDYGPLGVELLNNLKQEWWRAMTLRADVEGVDAAILMHPKVWEASGHVANFTDPMVDCKSCKARFRLDILLEELALKAKKKILRTLEPEAFAGRQQDSRVVDEFARRIADDEIAEKIITTMVACPNCGAGESFTAARQFNLMFKTHVGPLEDASSVVYLRPETAQGIFVNFFNVLNSTRQKLPFGIAQIGKAFRNEINTKNFLFRTREFEQMEMQFFVKPGDEDEWFEYWREQRMNWFLNLGFSTNKLKWHQHDKLAHYAKAAYDLEFDFPFGFGEVEGIHSRTDFDLSRHEEFSGKTLKYFDDASKEHYLPYVIETSIGASRTCMAAICAAYAEEQIGAADGKEEKRTVMHFHPRLAPMKAAVLPLVKRDGMDDIARKLTADLQRFFRVFYDESGAVGRRYRRQDEIGTPYCLTIDSQTLEDNTITVRERDSMQQERIGLDNARNYLLDKLAP
ncbi:MAG: glycine--tRNA ligase [Chitinivibrionales bacterium]|nr:glycine--tRNA ligase [Chitinivibrionales bacterium]